MFRRWDFMNVGRVPNVKSAVWSLHTPFVLSRRTQVVHSTAPFVFTSRAKCLQKGLGFWVRGCNLDSFTFEVRVWGLGTLTSRVWVQQRDPRLKSIAWGYSQRWHLYALQLTLTGLCIPHQELQGHPFHDRSYLKIFLTV